MQHRPRTLGFFVIKGGGIRNLKIHQVSVDMTRPMALEILISAFQPVAWTISTGGCENIHVHDNTIIAVSNSEVRMFARIPRHTGLKSFGFAGLATEHVSCLFSEILSRSIQPWFPAATVNFLFRA